MGFLTACKEARLENEKLRKRIEELTQPPDYPSGFPTFKVRFREMADELADLGIECQYKVKFKPDTYVLHTTIEAMAKIVPFLTYSGEYSAYQGADCDDYAIWAFADGSKLFQLGYAVFPVWGDMPLGKHAWAGTKVRIGTKVEFRYWEPNAGYPYAGVLFKASEHGYYPKSWR